MVVGWFYLFGGRSGARQVVFASVVDRLVFVPLIFLPLAFAGVFPHSLVAFAILDPLLEIGAWVLLSRKAWEVNRQGYSPSFSPATAGSANCHNCQFESER